MVKTTPWLPSSGVGPILGIGRPMPADIVRIAEEQAELERLAHNAETTLQLAINEVPIDSIHGFTIKLTTDVTKAKP